MNTLDLSNTLWEKSSYSDQQGGECVEFSRTLLSPAGVIPVRDSKNPTGPVLTVTPSAWADFITYAAR
ncbi:DUF397 domain-containing protein [Streptomyces sp. NPDC093085]|uniref:DUF397 domain-containing protein n=1 Tax=Streptomyces sp. NPDC093085 TaxID=3155068 RepID=UPI00342CD942